VTARRCARGFAPTISPVPSSHTGVPKISAAQPIGPITSTTAIRIENAAHHFGRTAVRNATTATPAKNGISDSSAPMKNMSERWCSVPAVAALMLSWLSAAAKSPPWIRTPNTVAAHAPANASTV
jgi:hypothetical protein